MRKIDKYNFENSVAEYLKNSPVPYLFCIGITLKDREGEPTSFQWLVREEGEKNIYITAIICSVVELEGKEVQPDLGAFLISLTKNDASEILTYSYLFGPESKKSKIFNALRDIEQLDYNEEAILLLILSKDFFGTKSLEEIDTVPFYRTMLSRLAEL